MIRRPVGNVGQPDQPQQAEQTEPEWLLRYTGDDKVSKVTCQVFTMRGCRRIMWAQRRRALHHFDGCDLGDYDGFV